MQIQEKDENSAPLLDLPTNMESELALLLHTYREVFSMPSSLPPTRFPDHIIPLVEESAPMKVKPYRYPYGERYAPRGDNPTKL